MAHDSQPALSEYLIRHYGALKRRVTHLLGSSDLASDALHDAWLRVNAEPAPPSDDESHPGEPGEASEAAHALPTSVRSPGSYLVRMAINIAVDTLRRNSRALPLDEVDALIELADPAPGPAQTAQARMEMQTLMQWLERMPERRREIFVLVHFENLLQSDVAQRLGCSKRTVEYELKHAHDYLARKLERDT
ncbi:sigma-70 family RNA polymerase sigma factor [Pandoraea sputorum]|uniref:RNA polymerase sigma factor n=1 Tax=Pandoraea sputorum TaxID=93222 RepID=UPI001E5B099F|nr:sigma-70 family RNA polymerase sigma factor [Pandoraea sputorum]MCE4062516.1 sigma-70 family RNA polymerase sigma factor [Pandoraea sputorum]